MKFQDSSMLSEVRASTSSQTTASESEPGAWRAARPPASDISLSTRSMAIEPTEGIASCFRSLITTLASSGETSHRITSPGGFRAAPRSDHDVDDGVLAEKKREGRVGFGEGAMIRR